MAKHFFDVDCLNNDHRTPAFVAAKAGCLTNLITLSNRGADLNQTVKCQHVKLTSSDNDPVRECRRIACEYSLLHIAAQEGNIDIVKFLIQHHVDVVKFTGCNNTALQLAAKNGHLEVVKTLKKAGGVLDGVSLHHAADGGHSSVVDYLLNEGVRDYCINHSHLKGQKNWRNTRIKMLDTRHLEMRETALHAAVKKEHLSVIESLLHQPENAANCVNAAGRRPLHEAVHLNNYNALRVMLEVGVDTSVRCNASLPISRLIPHLMLAGLKQNNYPCGFTALHIAAMHGYHSVAKLLITHKTDVNVRDCSGSTPLHIAACHGMVSLVTLLVYSGAKINRRSFNFSTPLHSAAACFATSSFFTLLESGSDFLARDNKNMTALHYIVQNIEVVGREYFADLYVDKPINSIEIVNEKEPWEKGDLQYTWLNTLIRITNKFTASINATKFWNLYKSISETYSNIFDILDKKNNASFLLTGSNSYDSSYLVAITTPAVFVLDIMVHKLVKSFDTFLPELLKKALLKVFTVFFPTKTNFCSLLTFSVRANTVRLTHTLLQAQVDINCQDKSGLTPLLTYLHSGGRHTSKVLANHKVMVDISCGDPFERSTLHMISYHKLHYLNYLSKFVLRKEKWSKYLKLDNSLFDYFLDDYKVVRDHNVSSSVIRTGDGPLALAIKSYPQGTEVINECFDADGYNALHRAAQGANVVAIKRFLAWGANPSLKTADGFTPLWLSVLYSVKYTPFLNFRWENILTGLEVDLASKSASLILNRLIQTGTVDIGCNESRPDLTLYHIAAIRGMWRFVKRLLSDKQLTGVDVNCPNRDGITPMYLAKLVGGVACDWHSPWCKVVEVITKNGGTLRYPNLEAEYFLFFHLFYGLSPGHMFLELPEREISSLEEDCERDKCQDKSGYSSLFKASFELDRVYNDYRIKVDDCDPIVHSEWCLPEIHRDLSHFQSVVSAVYEHQSFKSEHFLIRGHLSLLLESEGSLVQSFLLDVTRPYSRIQRRPRGTCCSKEGEQKTTYSYNEDSEQRTTTNHYNEDSQQRKQSKTKFSGRDKNCYDSVTLEASIHRSFLRFKESFDQLQERLKYVKSVVFAKGNFPRVLSGVEKALYSFYSTLYCDWQTNAASYVMLRFQIWNLKFFTKYVNENSRVVSISDFASFRMREALIAPSKDTLKLISRLVSEKTFHDLDYLTILKFSEPPLWNGTYDHWTPWCNVL